MPDIIEVECPKCNEILEVNLETKEVIGHKEKKGKTSLEEFMKAEKNKSAEIDKKFKEGVAKAKNKSNKIDEKFNDFLNNKDKYESDEPPESGIMWD